MRENSQIIESPSPFARPAPGLRVKPFVSTIPRPSHDEIAAFPQQARALLERTWSAQVAMPEMCGYNIHWIQGRHFIIAGATGAGLGGSLATALVNYLPELGSLTLVSRDLKRSLEFETGLAMKAQAEPAGHAKKFRLLNEGLAVEGPAFERLVGNLRELGAERVVYVNAVAAANSGMLPGYPAVYVKDIDDEGLFQWELQPLNERAIEGTKFFMGTMAARFPEELEKAGIGVTITVFCDWRGSLDGCSRVPGSHEYGRQGPYSTSLYLPKQIIQHATSKAFRSGRNVIDIFYPVMKTRALFLIPGGRLLHALYNKFMQVAGVRWVDVPELAMQTLDQIGRRFAGDDNPFPRLDMHEAALELWFFEILKRLNSDEGSEFYFRKWIDTDASAVA